MLPHEMPEWERAEDLITRHHQTSVLHVHHAAAFNHDWLAGTVSHFQAFLLRSYQWVLFAEADEFIFPASRGSMGIPTLREFIQDLGPEPPGAIRACGFEVVQQDGEPPISAELYESGSNVALTPGELMRDRRWWQRSEFYSKTVLAKTPLAWRPGFHSLEGRGQDIATGPPSDILMLAHLHKIDFQMAHRRLRRSRSRKWSERDIASRSGWQNRLENEEELRSFWHQDVDTGTPLDPARLSQVPGEVKRALGLAT
jgi:hypothetical protein